MVRRGMIREVRAVFVAAREAIDGDEENAGREKRRIGALKLEVVRDLRKLAHLEKETEEPPRTEEIPEAPKSSTKVVKRAERAGSSKPTGRGQARKERAGPGIAKARPTERAPKKGVA